MAMDEKRADIEELLQQLQQTTDPLVMYERAAEILRRVKREDNPGLWAHMQGMLGASLAESGGGALTEDLVRRILDAYEAALSVCDPQTSPLFRGQMQRNVGATHLGAVQNQVGDLREHVEAAMAAYEQALTVPASQQDRRIWRAAVNEFATTVAIAATWRGPSEYIRGARVVQVALAGLTREADAEDWALLQLHIGRFLNESAAAEVSEAAIEACERALMVFERNTRPRAWAEAHLVLGGLYRTRRTGDRAANLERATASLDAALSVFTPQQTANEWFRMHYHRGPAYLFRVEGEHEENLAKAIESLRIAADATSPELAPDSWGALQLSIGQAYLDRRSGDRVENIELAVSAFESALSVLPPDPRLPAWKQASRYLGMAYLARGRGDDQENVAKAIAVLTAVQQQLPEPDDAAAWSGAWADLALAWRCHDDGDRMRSRANAIACYEEAFRVPADAWVDLESWSVAQLAFGLLLLDEEAKSIGRSPVSRDITAHEPVAATSPIDPIRDPFDMRRQAGEQLAALQASGDRSLDLDPGWHVPSLLNDEASLLQRHFLQFLRTGAVLVRDPSEREALERQRLNIVLMVLEHLGEKQASAERTRTLFDEVSRGTRTFVLILRGFAMRAHRYEGITVINGGGESFAERWEKHRIASQLAPVPVVWISNPIDSGPMEMEANRHEAAGFRVESGENWQNDVRALIGAASSIIVHNPEMTPGLLTEIGFVRDAGRLEDTFFKSPSSASEVLGIECRALTDEALASVRAAARPRSTEHPLPLPACQWVEGRARENFETELRTWTPWITRLEAARTLVSTDFELDAWSYLLANAVLLEGLDRIPPILLAMSDALRSIQPEDLARAPQLADAYAQLADRIT